jgi:hypothetical protein
MPPSGHADVRGNTAKEWVLPDRTSEIFAGG